MQANTRTLFRPVGLVEMQLILEAEPHAFSAPKNLNNRFFILF